MLYILCLLLLIFLILASRGKGAEIGAAFNSSSVDLFGSSGSSSIINKLIITMALITLVINIFLNITFNSKNTKQDSLEINKYKTQR